jgi:hypothetical protein
LNVVPTSYVISVRIFNSPPYSTNKPHDGAKLPELQANGLEVWKRKKAAVERPLGYRGLPSVIHRLSTGTLNPIAKSGHAKINLVRSDLNCLECCTAIPCAKLGNLPAQRGFAADIAKLPEELCKIFIFEHGRSEKESCGQLERN